MAKRKDQEQAELRFNIQMRIARNIPAYSLEEIMRKRTAFLVRQEWGEDNDVLTQEEKAFLWDAMFRYNISGQEPDIPEDNRYLRRMWKDMKKCFNFDIRQYGEKARTLDINNMVTHVMALKKQGWDDAAIARDTPAYGAEPGPGGPGTEPHGPTTGPNINNNINNKSNIKSNIKSKSICRDAAASQTPPSPSIPQIKKEKVADRDKKTDTQEIMKFMGEYTPAMEQVARNLVNEFGEVAVLDAMENKVHREHGEDNLAYFMRLKKFLKGKTIPP